MGMPVPIWTSAQRFQPYPSYPSWSHSPTAAPMNTQEHTYKHTHFIAYFIFPTEFECEMSSGSILHTHTQYQPFNEPASQAVWNPPEPVVPPGTPKKTCWDTVQKSAKSQSQCCPSSPVSKTEGDPKTPLSVRDTCTEWLRICKQNVVLQSQHSFLGFSVFFLWNLQLQNLAFSNYLLSPSGTLPLEKKTNLPEHALWKPSPEPIPKHSVFQKNCKWQSLT